MESGTYLLIRIDDIIGEIGMIRRIQASQAGAAKTLSAAIWGDLGVSRYLPRKDDAEGMFLQRVESREVLELKDDKAGKRGREKSSAPRRPSGRCLTRSLCWRPMQCGCGPWCVQALALCTLRLDLTGLVDHAPRPSAPRSGDRECAVGKVTKHDALCLHHHHHSICMLAVFLSIC